MKKKLKYLVFLASFQLTTILIMMVSAPAAEISRIPFSFQGSFDFPVGSVCSFNYHGEVLVEGYTKEQRDAEGVKKTIDHVTIHETDVNVDTGYTISGIAHQVNTLDGFVDGQPGHIRISGQNYHLRDLDGKLIVHHSGHLSLDIETDSGKVTPNFGPHFNEVICPALGGDFRHGPCGDSSCESGFETSETCPYDCGTCNTNGVCEPGLGESHIVCAADCGQLCGPGEILCYPGTFCGRICDGILECSQGNYIDVVLGLDPPFTDENSCETSVGVCEPGTFPCSFDPPICITPCEGGDLSDVELGNGPRFSCNFGEYPSEEGTLFCGGCGDGVCQNFENPTTCPADCL